MGRGHGAQAGNWGGSFLAVPEQRARTRRTPSTLANWLTAPEQQAKLFAEAGQLPEFAQALAYPRSKVTRATSTSTTHPSGRSSPTPPRASPRSVLGPKDQLIQENIGNIGILQVEQQGKSPEEGWEAAVKKIDDAGEVTWQPEPTPPRPPRGARPGRRRRVAPPRSAAAAAYRRDARWSPYAFIAPFFLFFAAFGLFPLLYTGWASLHNVCAADPTRHGVGGAATTSRGCCEDEFFWNALRNTVTIGVISTVPQLAMALGLAHLLNYRLRGSMFFRVVMLTPYATSVAAATLVFALLFGRDYGMINWGLGLVGFDPSTGRTARGRRRSPSRPS